MPEPVLQTMYIRSPGGKRLERLSPEALVIVGTGRLVSPQVEAAALTIIDQIQELDRGLPLPDFLKPKRPLSRSVIVILQYYSIQKENLRDLIRLLSHLGYAHNFFSLAEPDNDDGLKKYLLNDGILWNTIFEYHEFSAWDGVKLVDGFLIGLGASYVLILESLKELFDFTVDAFNDPEEAGKKIGSLFNGIKQLAGEALFKMGVATWQKVNYDFSQALLNLEFFEAGYILGKLAGDLWQLLTGIAALRKLPGMTMKLARQFAPIFAAGARKSSLALKMVGEFVARYGKAVFEAPNIGLAAMLNFLDDPGILFEALEKGCLAFTDKMGNLFTIMPDTIPLPAGGTALIEPGFLISQEVDGVSTFVARIKAGDIYDRGRKVLQSFAKQVKKSKITIEELKDLEKFHLIAQETVVEWGKFLDNLVKDKKLVGNIGKLSPSEFGVFLDMHMRGALDDIVSVFNKLPGKSKGKFKAIANNLKDAEKKFDLRYLAEELKLPSDIAERTETSLLDLIKSNKKLLKTLDVDEKGLIKFLKDLGYKNPEKTLLGDLVPDGIIYCESAKRLISIDWTSGWQRIKFSNKVDELLKAGKKLTNEEILRMAADMMDHGVREYVIRAEALSYIFEGWATSAIEAVYHPFRYVK